MTSLRNGGAPRPEGEGPKDTVLHKTSPKAPGKGPWGHSRLPPVTTWFTARQAECVKYYGVTARLSPGSVTEHHTPPDKCSAFLYLSRHWGRENRVCLAGVCELGQPGVSSAESEVPAPRGHSVT